VREANYEADHMHLLVEYPPKVALSTLVNSLKGVSARRLRQAGLPDVQRKLWGQHFWSPSYCAVSCGGSPARDHQTLHTGATRGFLPALKGGASAPEDLVNVYGRKLRNGHGTVTGS
jgi:hypothetical protein